MLEKPEHGKNFRTDDSFVQKLCTYVMILDYCGDFDSLRDKFGGLRLQN